MSELVEGARLEIVCTVKSGTEGSNPSLSAKRNTKIWFREETFEKRSVLFKVKTGEDFNRRNTFSILRVEI